VGLLLACFSDCKHHATFCLVRVLQPVDNQECNEYDCPILSMSNLIYCIPAKHVYHSVSVVHECTNSCSFVTTSIQKRIEQEDVCVSQLTFSHDWSNKLFSLNLYCMN
jgi:hypothetical protein